MIRRVYVRCLKIGSIALDGAEAHQVRDVLRMEVGSPLALFDDAGNQAAGVIRHVNVANVVVDVAEIRAVSFSYPLTVAAAVPKGDRADWMVEKLTELGVAAFIPLATRRSVVVPAGRNKMSRWERISIEAAKQSHRPGVMKIAEVTTLDEVIALGNTGCFLSTASTAVPLMQLAYAGSSLTLLIGPEGGWADEEIEQMLAAGFMESGLTRTILRVETAAALAAGIVLCKQQTMAVRSSSNTDSTLP